MTKRGCVLVLVLACSLWTTTSARRATYTVCADASCDYANTELQAAINAAVGGDVILLQEDFTYQGTFVLPYHTTPTSYVTIQTGVTSAGATSNAGNFPASGVRVTSTQADTGNFAKLQSITSNQPAVRTTYTANPPAQYWRLKWIEVLPNAGSTLGTGPLVQLGSDSNTYQPSTAYEPHHFELTQTYIHGSATRGQFRCVTIHASNTTVEDSTIDNCWTATGYEGQAIWLNGYTSTVSIENNTISGGSEVILQGGSAGGMRPTGVTVLASDRTTTAATLSSIAELHVGQGLSFLVNGLEQYTEIASCGTSVADAACTSVDVTFAPALSAPPDSPGGTNWGARPSGLSLRLNTITKPLAGKTAFIATPASLAAAASTDTTGTLTSGESLCYRVIARRRTSGQSTSNAARSTAAAEQCATVTATGAVDVSWTAGTDIDSYDVYAGPTGAQTRRFTTTSATFTDTGAAGTTAAVPTSDGTRMASKNTVEIKNGRDWLIEGNIIEHSWYQAQNGFLLVLTPANTGNGNDSTVVKDGEARYNIFRGANGGIQATTRDACFESGTAVTKCGTNSATGVSYPFQPSGLLSDINIHNNLWYDLGSHWGLSIQWFIISGGSTGGVAMYNTGSLSPTNITINHNTILQTSGQAFLNLNLSGATHAATNFDFMNNIAIKTSNGLTGNLSCTQGNDCWTDHTLAGGGSEWQNNFVADVTCANYPGGCTETLTATTATLMGYFVDAAAGNYRLTGGTPLDSAGTDNADLGADIVTLESVMGGATAPPSAAAPAITTTTLPDATVGAPYSATVLVDGGTLPLTCSITVGSLSNGLALNASTCTISADAVTGTAGTINITVQVADSEGTPRTDTQALSIVVVAAPAALTISTTSPLPSGDAVIPLPYCYTLTATGGTSPYTWDVTDTAQLPPGIAMREDGRLGCEGAVPTTGGTYNFTARVTDSTSTVTTKALQLVVTAQTVSGCTRSNSVTVGGIPIAAGSFIGPTAPTTCVRAGDVWKDTSVNPPVTKVASSASPAPAWTVEASSGGSTSSTPQPLLSASDAVVPDTLVAGSLLVRSTDGLWEALSPGTQGTRLGMTADGPQWLTSSWTPQTVTLIAGPVTTLNPPAGGVEVGVDDDAAGREPYRLKMDAQGYSLVSLSVNVSTTACASGSLKIQYYVTGWVDISGLSLSCTTVNTWALTSFVTLPTAARVEGVTFRGVFTAGDGTADPIITRVSLSFRP